MFSNLLFITLSILAWTVIGGAAAVLTLPDCELHSTECTAPLVLRSYWRELQDLQAILWQECVIQPVASLLQTQAMTDYFHSPVLYCENFWQEAHRPLLAPLPAFIS